MLASRSWLIDDPEAIHIVFDRIDLMKSRIRYTKVVDNVPA